MSRSDLHAEFLKEAAEHLAIAEECLLALDAGDSSPQETIHRLFRALHTLKGAASFLELRPVMELSHALEDLVAKLRSGAIQPTGAIVDALLTGVDRLEARLLAPEGHLGPADADIAPIREAAAQALAESSGGETSAVRAGHPLPPHAQATEPQIPKPQKPEPQRPEPQNPRHLAAQMPMASLPNAPSAAAVALSPKEASAEATPAARGPTAVTIPQTVRIPVATLDKLMDLASELVLVRNQNLQAVQSGRPDQLPIIAQRLNLVTSELQASVMHTRMRPVKPVFGRFTRVVRDLAKSLGKDVEFEVGGDEVELDKSIVEAIGDPLMHLIRNAVDHGIEDAAARRKAGKKPRGSISIRAMHRAGQVLIELEDDGRGIDPHALISSALRLGLLSSERAQTLPVHEAFNLMFLPGVSTSKAITAVSGRGVGMDAVQAAFKALGGVVDLSSELGVGTTVTVKLPLTLAIVPALIITIEGMRFAIPQAHIHEVILLYGGHLSQDLKAVDGQEVYQLRGRLLPVVRLAKLLGIEKTYGEPRSGARLPDRRAQAPDRRQQHLAEAAPQEADPRRRGPGERRSSLNNRANIVVLKAGTERFGLIVDAVVDTEEIVVKPLHDQLASCAAYAGTTVLGDGHIALILDIAGILDLGQLRIRDAATVSTRIERSPAPQETVLLFDIGGAETFAVPLRMLARVEALAPGDLHIAGGQEYLAFGTSTLPIVRIDQALTGFSSRYDGPALHVLVPRARQSVGILVAAIRDTVRVDCEIDAETVAHPYVFGSFLVEGHLALLVDLIGVATRARASHLHLDGAGPRKRVLLVEDSPLYAALISPSLQAMDLSVRLASNGAEALRVLRSEPMDVIVSDIDMPVMDGYEFAKRIRASQEWAHLPMLAISAGDAEAVEPRALAAGFNAFRTKHESKPMLDALMALLNTMQLEAPDA